MSQLWEFSAREVRDKVAAGDLRASEVVQASLGRIEDVNPAVNAIVEVFADEAMEAAELLDAGIARGDEPGSLAGVPITIKDNIDCAGHANTNGLRIQKDNVVDQDSPVVTNLRRAGAIILGRTNTPAFSMRWFTRNSLFGHTLNPRNSDLTPGGSSGGAAAAVAAGMCAIGHGTDIAGSVRYPAYACGLQGIRPTLGRIPAVNRSLPDRHIGAQITAVSGPLGRTVEDVRLGYEAMSRSSNLDPWYSPAPHIGDDFPRRVALNLNPDGMQTCAESIGALHDSADRLRDAGWKVEEAEIPPMREPMEMQLALWMSEYQYTRGQNIHREDDPDANFIYEQMMDYIAAPTLESFMEVLQRRVTLAREWQVFLGQYPLLLCPVSAEPPFPDLLDVASPASFRRVIEAQMTQIGIPLLSVPAMTVCTGIADGVPMGVQLVAGRFREDILFAAAAQIEERGESVTIATPEKSQ